MEKFPKKEDMPMQPDLQIVPNPEPEIEKKDKISPEQLREIIERIQQEENDEIEKENDTPTLH